MNMQTLCSAKKRASWKKLSPITLMASKVFVSELLKEEAEKYLEQGKLAIARRRIEQARFNDLPLQDYNFLMAKYYWFSGDLQKSIGHFKACSRYCTTDEDTERKAYCHNQISLMYSQIGNSRQAKYHAIKAYDLYNANKDQKWHWNLILDIAYQLRQCGYKDLGRNIYKDFYGETKDPLVKRAFFNSLVSDGYYQSAIDLAMDVPPSQITDYRNGIETACTELGNETMRGHFKRRINTFYKNEMHDAFNDYADIKPTDPEISVNGMTIDLKQLEDGSIRILEINFLPASGLKGYDAHHKTALSDKVTAHYSFLSRYLAQNGYYDSETDSYLKCSFVGAESPTTFSNWMVMTHSGRPVLLDSSLHALMGQHYKDEFVLSVQDNGLASFIPQSIVASRYQTADHILRQAQSFTSENLVLKTSHAYRGDGVEIIPAAQLPAAVDAILNGGSWSGCHTPRAWENDYHPNFVIQECVHSKPCRAQNGKNYDATMRVALTHVFNHSSGNAEILIHGMFWKLPKTPISEGTKRDRIVSLAKNQDVIRGNPHSARVSPVRQAQVERQLIQFFEDYSHHLAMPNSQVIRQKKDLIKTPSIDPRVLLATEQLTSHPYGNLISLLDKDNPDAFRSFRDFAEVVKNPHIDEIQKAILTESYRDIELTTQRSGLVTSRSHNL